MLFTLWRKSLAWIVIKRLQLLEYFLVFLIASGSVLLVFYSWVKDISRATYSEWFHADNLMWKFWWANNPSLHTNEWAEKFKVEERLSPQGIMLIGKRLTAFFGEITAYNLLLFVSFPLTTLSSYLLLSYFLKNRYLRFVLALSSAFVPYHIAHLYQLSLSQIWVFPLFLYLFMRYLKFPKLNNLLFLGIFFNLTFFIDLYYFYFLFLLLFLLLVCQLLFNYQAWLNCVKLSLTIAFFSLFLLPQIFIIKDSLNNYQKLHLDELKRGRNELIYYSARPWDYFLPAYNNIFLGNISYQTYGRIRQYHPENYLFDHWKGGETEAFIGYTFIILGLTSLLIIKKLDSGTSRLVITLQIIWPILFILSLPPDIFLPFKIFGKDHFILLGHYLNNLIPFFRAYGRVRI